MCIIPKRAICSFVIIIFLYDHTRKDICLYVFFNYCFSRTFFFLLVDKTISSGMVRVRVYFPS